MILASALMAAQIAMAEPERRMMPHVQNVAVESVSCGKGIKPEIEVSVGTDEIEYDYSKNSKQLSAIKTDTKSPYPPGVDTVTEGLRTDTPSIETKIRWMTETEQRSRMSCMQFESINVHIHLKPKIMIAREYKQGECYDAILKHERKHVQVDREVMNKYARVIGRTVKSIADRSGMTGPFPVAETDKLQQQSSRDVSRAIDHIQSAMMNELNHRQQEVDSLQEYERVGKICGNPAKKEGR